MADPFIAEIRIFAGNFAPRGWALCDGRVLPIAQNTALFSLIGTTYGGDGRTTTGLPNLVGRVPMHPGRGPGLTQRRLGEKSGQQNVSLSTGQLPSHTHTAYATSNGATDTSPSNARVPAAADENTFAGGSPVPMSAAMLQSSGGGGAHNNMQPYLVINYIIALVGQYPSRP